MRVEARDRVGGRTLNAPIGDGKVVEIGGQWVGPGHTRIRVGAAELGVETFPAHIAGDHLYSRRGRVSRYRSDVPRRNLAGFADYQLAQARLERMARSVDLEAGASVIIGANGQVATATASCGGERLIGGRPEYHGTLPPSTTPFPGGPSIPTR